MIYIKKFFWKHKVKRFSLCAKLVLGHTLNSSNPHTVHKSTMVSGTTLPSWTGSYTNKFSKTKQILFLSKISKKRITLLIALMCKRTFLVYLGFASIAVNCSWVNKRPIVNCFMIIIKTFIFSDVKEVRWWLQCILQKNEVVLALHF